MTKTVLAVLAVLAIVGGIGAGYMWVAQQGQQEPVEVEEQAEQVEAVEEATVGQAGHQGPRGGGHGSHGAEGACKNIGTMEPRDAIQWLLDNHDIFNYTYTLYPENMTIEWIITAPDRDSIEVLYYHILQMRCAIENGGTPRRHDPVFQLDARIGKDYINTSIVYINETAVKVVKTAENECAYEVMKLHAQVIQQFFEEGRPAASVPHEVPQDVLELCKPYLDGGATG